MENKMTNGNGRIGITVSLNKELLSTFRHHCQTHGYMLSARLEILMKKELEDSKIQ